MSYKDAIELISSAPYFTKQNLGLGIGGNTQYWVKKLLREGLLISLKNGTYLSKYYLNQVVKDPKQLELYFEYLANVIRRPSYVSLEYMLSKYGAIPEAVFALTSVTTKSTKTYNTEIKSFIYKSISSDLFCGYGEDTFEDKIVLTATRSKALFDFIYFKDLESDDIKDFLETGARINWSVFNKNDLKEFEYYAAKTNFVKMPQALEIIKGGNLIC